MPNGCEFEGRYVHVGTYPIGIEPTQFQETLKKESVVKRIGALERRFEGVKIIVGVDRLDYIKGVPQKLHALECFLGDHPEWIGKVSSRDADGGDQLRLESEIESLKMNLNATYTLSLSISISAGCPSSSCSSFSSRRRGVSKSKSFSQ